MKKLPLGNPYEKGSEGSRCDQIGAWNAWGL